MKQPASTTKRLLMEIPQEVAPGSIHRRKRNFRKPFSEAGPVGIKRLRDGIIVVGDALVLICKESVPRMHLCPATKRARPPGCKAASEAICKQIPGRQAGIWKRKISEKKLKSAVPTRYSHIQDSGLCFSQVGTRLHGLHGLRDLQLLVRFAQPAPLAAIALHPGSLLSPVLSAVQIPMCRLPVSPGGVFGCIEPQSHLGHGMMAGLGCTKNTTTLFDAR